MTTGPLSGAVLEYDRVMTQLVPTVKRPADWKPLTRFIAVKDFERIGTFLEVQDWDTYAQMSTGWAHAIDSFETSVHRVSEVSNLVYYEVGVIRNSSGYLGKAVARRSGRRWRS